MLDEKATFFQLNEWPTLLAICERKKISEESKIPFWAKLHFQQIIHQLCQISFLKTSFNLLKSPTILSTNWRPNSALLSKSTRWRSLKQTSSTRVTRSTTGFPGSKLIPLLGCKLKILKAGKLVAFPDVWKLILRINCQVAADKNQQQTKTNKQITIINIKDQLNMETAVTSSKQFRLCPLLNLEPEMKYPKCNFKITKMGGGLACVDGGKTVKKTLPGNLWKTAVVNYEMKDDSKYYWHFLVDGMDASKLIMLGIVNENFDYTQNGVYPGSDDNGMGYYCANGYKYKASGVAFTAPAKGNGDEIGMVVDLVERTLSFSLNGEHLGTAYGPFQIPKGKTWYPAVAIHSSGSVTICDVAKQAQN